MVSGVARVRGGTLVLPQRRWLLWKGLRVLLTGSAFLLFWLLGVIVAWLILPLVFALPRDNAARAQRRCRQVISTGLHFFVGYMRLCRLIAFDRRSIRAQLPQGAFVLVANHPTLIDVVLLLASYPSICCVAKGSLFSSLLIGPVLRLCGHIDAGDGGIQAGAGVGLGALERLGRGDPVLIFPEATRSPPGGLGPFKGGAFRLASRAGVPLIPVHIQASPPALMKGMPWYTVPDGTVRFEMAILQAFHPAVYGGDVKAFTADVRALFERTADASAGLALEKKE